MSSRLLDYERMGRRARQGSVAPPIQHVDAPTAVAALVTPVAPIAPVAAIPTPAPNPMAPTDAIPLKGPLDFPAIVNWLNTCEEDFERGRDKHEYSRLAAVFAANGCTRIDDIACLSPDNIMALAAEVGVIVTVGLVNRVHHYAIDDVAHVKIAGKLTR